MTLHQWVVRGILRPNNNWCLGVVSMKYSSDSWSSYWEQGSLTSLPIDFKLNYDREVDEFWQDTFSKLSNNAVIIDVCSGNGAIAFLAAKYCIENGKAFSIYATDAANIKPELIARKDPMLQKQASLINFKPGVLLEEFSLENVQADLITSQYGIEYCLNEVTARKLFELSKKGGRLVAITHSVKTPIANITKNDYQLLDTVNFFTRVKKLIKNDSSQKEYQIFFKDVYKELERSMLSKVSPVLKPLVDACKFILQSNSKEFNEGKAHLESFLTKFLHGRQRLNELLAVHKIMNEDKEWYSPLLENQFRLEEQKTVMLNGTNPVGDSYIFHKV